MTSREQITFERVEALLDYLNQQGVLEDNWREALRDIDSPEKGREARQKAREGLGPPDWANAGENSGGNE